LAPPAVHRRLRGDGQPGPGPHHPDRRGAQHAGGDRAQPAVGLAPGGTPAGPGLRGRLQRLAPGQIGGRPAAPARLLHTGLQQLWQEPERLDATAATGSRQGRRQGLRAQGPVGAALDRHRRDHGGNLRRTRHRQQPGQHQAPVL
ncbi:hypothetical protein KXX11_004087, partial [Aspergillus fumigatus]